MPNLTVTNDADEADQFMIKMLQNTGDTAIWCIRKAHEYLVEERGPHNWTDIDDNMKILRAVNELLEYYGAKPLDLATHKLEMPL